MARRTSSTRRAFVYDDISGFKVPYNRTRKTWDGYRTASPDWQPKHPKIDPQPVRPEPERLPDPRPDLDHPSATLDYDQLNHYGVLAGLNVGFSSRNLAFYAQVSGLSTSLALGTPSIVVFTGIFPTGQEISTSIGATSNVAIEPAITNIIQSALNSTLQTSQISETGNASALALGSVSIAIDEGWGGESWGSDAWGL